MQSVREFRVAEKINPSDGLCRLMLVPADGQPVFPYRAGQFVMLREQCSDGYSTHPRAFSLASAPCESGDKIELGIKAQGALSTALCSIKGGEVLMVQGPYGMFTLNKEAKRIVFFAGGVGMTPFRSHIRESLLTGLDQELVLFYSGGTAKELMYHEEFLDLSGKYPNFKYIPLLTRECPMGWVGECRRLDGEVIDKYVKDFSIGEYMMCGPALMMESVRDLLQLRGVDVDQRLRFERY